MKTPAPDSTPPRRPMFGAALIALALVVAAPAWAQSENDGPMPDAAAVDTRSNSAADSAMLEPGEYRWTPQASPAGPMVIVVSLPEQRAHVYRNGIRIGVSTISSGKPGNDTPTGVFPILQKREVHHSNLYDGAPMPYMQRLTWDGIALHAGRIPGYPASHGCVRLPKAFAKILFEHTEHGVTVVIADENSHGPAVVWPSERAPVDAITGLEHGSLSDHVAGQPDPGAGNSVASME